MCFECVNIDQAHTPGSSGFLPFPFSKTVIPVIYVAWTAPLSTSVCNLWFKLLIGRSQKLDVDFWLHGGVGTPAPVVFKGHLYF